MHFCICRLDLFYVINSSLWFSCVVVVVLVTQNCDGLNTEVKSVMHMETCTRSHLWQRVVEGRFLDNRQLGWPDYQSVRLTLVPQQLGWCAPKMPVLVSPVQSGPLLWDVQVHSGIPCWGCLMWWTEFPGPAGYLTLLCTGSSSEDSALCNTHIFSLKAIPN